jgi:hypothetical protein
MLSDTQSDDEFIDSLLGSNVKTNSNINTENNTIDEINFGKGGENDMNEPKIYNADNIPDDAKVFTGSTTEFNPIDPSEKYTVEILKADLQDNFYFKPDETDKSKQGSKYVIGFEFAILDEGEFYGRRLWASVGLALKSITKRGEPTILYKIVNSALKMSMDESECMAFAPDVKTLVLHLQNEVIGKQVKIGIENSINPKTSKTKSKIKSYNPTKKELAKFDQEKSKLQAEKNKKQQEEDKKKKDDTIPF